MCTLIGQPLRTFTQAARLLLRRNGHLVVSSHGLGRLEVDHPRREGDLDGVAVEEAGAGQRPAFDDLRTGRDGLHSEQAQIDSLLVVQLAGDANRQVVEAGCFVQAGPAGEIRDLKGALGRGHQQH